MTNQLNREIKYKGIYHGLTIALYAEETFLRAVDWIEAYNERHPEAPLTLIQGIIRLAEIGLEVRSQ